MITQYLFYALFFWKSNLSNSLFFSIYSFHTVSWRFWCVFSYFSVYSLWSAISWFLRGVSAGSFPLRIRAYNLLYDFANSVWSGWLNHFSLRDFRLAYLLQVVEVSLYILGWRMWFTQKFYLVNCRRVFTRNYCYQENLKKHLLMIQEQAEEIAGEEIIYCLWNCGTEKPASWWYIFLLIFGAFALTIFIRILYCF